MKTTIIILTTIVFAFSTLNVSAQRSNKTGDIETYNSCGEKPEPPPRPAFMSDLYGLSKKEIKAYARQLKISSKEFNFDYCIVVSSTVSNNDVKDIKTKATPSDAEELAWQRARKRLYESYIDKFTAVATSGGSSMIDKASLKESMYQFITTNVKGVSPLTSLKQVVVFDECPDNPGYTCYTLTYIRKGELDKRLKDLSEAVKEIEPNEKFEFWYSKWLEKYTN